MTADQIITIAFLFTIAIYTGLAFRRHINNLIQQNMEKSVKLSDMYANELKLASEGFILQIITSKNGWNAEYVEIAKTELLKKLEN